MKESDNKAQGFLFIDKKEGWTSIDVDRQAKRIFHQKRVGHLGTLDPFATGLLIVAVGEATKFLSLLDDGYKIYEARLRLGRSTTTWDFTGEALKECPVPNLSKEEISRCLLSFKGYSMQIPPIYSAKRIQGERAYDLARQGKDVHLDSHQIHIPEIQLLSYDAEMNSIEFRATVSKGTYLRSLGVDIAHRLNTEGYLDRLRRLQVGPYHVEDAIDIENATSDDLRALPCVIPDCQSRILEEDYLERARNGSPLLLPPESEFLLVLDKDECPIALYRRSADRYRCVRGFRHD